MNFAFQSKIGGIKNEKNQTLEYLEKPVFHMWKREVCFHMRL